MRHLLNVKHVSKSFKTQSVLEDENFCLTEGEIVGLIGQNGAGKTTLMKMLLGLLTVSTGEISYQGDTNYQHDPEKMANFGVLLDCRLFDYLSGFENMLIFESYRNVNKTDNNIKKQIKTMLDFVNLSNNKKPVKSYSFGMKQRLGLGLALINHPKILILDEPFVGLDPVGVEHFKQYILELKQNYNITVLISSHQLEEIEQMCDRCLLIKDKTILDIKHHFNQKYKLEFEAAEPAVLNKLSKIGLVQNDTTTVFKDELNLNTAINILNHHHVRIIAIKDLSHALTDLFGDDK